MLPGLEPELGQELQPPQPLLHDQGGARSKMYSMSQASAEQELKPLQLRISGKHSGGMGASSGGEHRTTLPGRVSVVFFPISPHLPS